MSHRLPLVTLYLTERCNSRCISCDYWRHGTRDLRPGLIDEMLPDLARLGTATVLISGGEPLVHREWRLIADRLRAEGFGLWLLTAGLALEKVATDVAGRFDSVTVSVDGACAVTYRAIRGVDAFDRVCAGIRAVASAGVPTSIRVTLQRANFRELIEFVSLARELGASQISFLGIDTTSTEAFARREPASVALALDEAEIGEFGALVDVLEVEHRDAFATGFIAQSPARLRRIGRYFAALRGLASFPAVRCNAPEFSAVVGADGAVSPCFFIPGPESSPRAPALAAAVDSDAMRALRRAIRARERPECDRCVCSMWREPGASADAAFRLGARFDD